MTTTRAIENLTLFEILQLVVSRMKVDGIFSLTEDGELQSNINFQAGRSSQIIEELMKDDRGLTTKGEKYPLIALMMPNREKMGTGFYSTVRIPKIIIATISNPNDTVVERYSETGNYKKILYPCLNAYFVSLAKSPYINLSDPNAFVCERQDFPAIQPVSLAEGLHDYIDTIEILNLELTLINYKIC